MTNQFFCNNQTNKPRITATKHWYFTAWCYAERGRPIAPAKLSVRLSVCLSVTLRYRDHICWNSSKIISPSVEMPALCRPQHHGSTARGTLKVLTGIGEGYRKSGFQRTKALTSLKRGQIGPRLLLIGQIGSQIRPLLVQKSMTSDDL